MEKNTFTDELENETVERVSRDRVMYIPTPRIKDKPKRVSCSMMIEELTASTYPTCKLPSTCHLHTVASLPVLNGFRRLVSSQSNPKQQTQAANTELPIISKAPLMITQAVSSQEYVIDQINIHHINKI